MDHWLAAQVTRIRALAEEAARQIPRPGMTRNDDRRRALLVAVRELVESVVTRDGVTACIACFEGLPVAAAGKAPPSMVEAVAAMSQRCVEAGEVTADTLVLGPLTQMLVVGERHKVALVTFGPLSVAILSPAQTSLAGSLAT